MYKLLLSLLLLGALIAYAGPTSAWEFTTPGNSYTNGSWAFGAVFTVNDAPITVTALGYYDDAADGFVSSHDLALYDMSGTPLAAITVTGVNPLVGHFRYADIEPLRLSANTQYEVVGVSQDDLYTWRDAGSPSIR